jgi:hypothetical protein
LFNAAATANLWKFERNEFVPTDIALKAVSKYVKMNVEAVRIGKAWLKLGAGMGAASRRVCHDQPLQYALFLDAQLWPLLNNTLRADVVKEFDIVGVYPDLAHLSLYVPLHLWKMQQAGDPSVWYARQAPVPVSLESLTRCRCNRLRRICATLLTPFPVTFNMDSDALPCNPNWTQLFAQLDGLDFLSRPSRPLTFQSHVTSC